MILDIPYNELDQQIKMERVLKTACSLQKKFLKLLNNSSSYDNGRRRFECRLILKSPSVPASATANFASDFDRRDQISATPGL